MEKVLDTLNFQMRMGRRNVILFLDNAAVHPTSLFDMYSNIKIIFFPKNATSRLQALDAGIIQSLKANTAQKMKFFIKDFFSKCDQIRSLLRIWSHVLKKSLMENFIFCAVKMTKEVDGLRYYTYN